MPAVTEQLRELAEDFGGRVSQWGWWNDALLVGCMHPQDEAGDVRKIARRVYLIGPSTEDPPMRLMRRSVRGAHEWGLIRTPDAVDLDLFTSAVATRPLPQRGKYLNFLVVHFKRGEDGSAKGRFGFAHHQQLETTMAEENLDDTTWLRNVLGELGVCVLP